LQRHLAAQRLGLLGQEDDAESPLADLLQQLVRTDDIAGPLAQRLLEGGDGPGGHGLQEVAGPRMCVQQFLHPAAEFGVAGAGLAQVGGPRFGGLTLKGLTENGIDVGRFVVHGITQAEIRGYLSMRVSGLTRLTEWEKDRFGQAVSESLSAA